MEFGASKSFALSSKKNSRFHTPPCDCKVFHFLIKITGLSYAAVRPVSQHLCRF